MLACWQSYCRLVLWVMLGREKQQTGPFGQGIMFPESGEGKIPGKRKNMRMYVCPCLWEEGVCSSVVLGVHKAIKRDLKCLPK